MDNENIFLKHKFLITLFLITFIGFMYCYYTSAMGLYFDIPNMFSGMFYVKSQYPSNFVFFNDNRPRLFNNLLVAVPFNLLFGYVKNLPAINALKLFSTSYFVVHLFGLIVNYLVALRTKRYDIAAVAFCFYCLFSVPNAIWSVRELHIAVLFYFALLSYFLSKEKLHPIDLIPISLLVIYTFESFEIIMILGVLLYVFMRLYVKKEDKNVWYKIFIGISCLIAAIYMPLRLLLLAMDKELMFSAGLNEWILGIIITFTHLFESNLLIAVFAIIAIIASVFYKKSLINPLMVPILALYIIIVEMVLYHQTGYFAEPHLELQYYGIGLVLFFPVVFLIILFDYFKIDVNNYNKYFFSNLVVFACIFGILGLIWQIHSSYDFRNYVIYMKNLINLSEDNSFITIPEEDFKKHRFLEYNNCYGITLKSVYLSKTKEINKLLLPAQYYNDYSIFCFAGDEFTYFDKKKQEVYLQGTAFQVKNNYWDLTPIAKKLEEESIIYEGRKKPLVIYKKK